MKEERGGLVGKFVCDPATSAAGECRRGGTKMVEGIKTVVL